MHEFHRDEIRQALAPVDKALATLRDGPYAELQRRVQAAIDDGIVASTLPLQELSLVFLFGRVSGDVYFENWRRTLVRGGWLTS